MLTPRCSLALSHHLFLLSIASSWSSRLDFVFAHSWYKGFAGRPTLACPCVWVQKRTLLKSPILFLQQCHTWLPHCSWIISDMGGRWLCNYRFVGFCFQYLLSTERRIPEEFPLSFLSMRFVSVPPTHTHTHTHTYIYIYIYIYVYIERTLSFMTMMIYWKILGSISPIPKILVRFFFTIHYNSLTNIHTGRHAPHNINSIDRKNSKWTI